MTRKLCTHKNIEPLKTKPCIRQNNNNHYLWIEMANVLLSDHIIIWVSQQPTHNEVPTAQPPPPF